eukprot:6447261-Karenia_brevis.AAC.1
MDKMTCAGCGEEIKQRTIRMMCLKTECAFHVCNTCKVKAEAATGAEPMGMTDAEREDGGESNKRGRVHQGQTPTSEHKPKKKGREAGAPTHPTDNIALTPTIT